MTSRDPFGGRRPPSLPSDDVLRRPGGGLRGGRTLGAPGAFIEEVSTPSRLIEGAPTSIAGFVGAFVKGPLDLAIEIHSVGDLIREFGPLRSDDETGNAIAQFFRNGGTRARVVRVASGADAAGALLLDASDEPAFRMTAGRQIDGESTPDPGVWGDTIRVEVIAGSTPGSFTLSVSQIVELSGTPSIEEVERYEELTVDVGDSSYCVATVNEASRMIQLQPATASPGLPVPAVVGLSGGENGSLPDASTLAGDPNSATGIFALSSQGDVAIIVVPGAVAEHLDVADTSLVYSATLEVCEEIHAFLIVDMPHDIAGLENAGPWIDSVHVRHPNAAAYFPRVGVVDPMTGANATLGSAGSVAGVYARTDDARGVWKAPAGTGAGMRGIADLAADVNDAASDLLNPLGINALRMLPGRGPTVWGARTLVGEDSRHSEWRYVNVRRTALFLETSIDRGLQWTVFEPNGEQLWNDIRAAVVGFLDGLFRQGAFQGSRSEEAFFVRCDSSTTTELDRRNGIVNLLIGVAPLKPAEFVVIKLMLAAQPA